MDYQYLIDTLNLEPHPEGGWYKEVYRSEQQIGKGDMFPLGRCYMTSIYFLITAESFSALHRIKSDETWHFYTGDPLEIIEIDDSGNKISTLIGNKPGYGYPFQYTVKSNRWFGSRVLGGGRWALVGCNVAPGFDFRDFELASRGKLSALLPQHSDIIKMLTRG